MTLTYDHEHVPLEGKSEFDQVPLPTLKKKDVQDFLKRIRKALNGWPLRYMAVGEYGAKWLRPHYHLVMFTPFDPTYMDELVREKWPNGFTSCYPASSAAMMYVAKYTLKKLGDQEELDGRAPPFMTSSRRPGLGCNYLEELIQFYCRQKGELILEHGYGDIQSNFHSEGKTWPLDRTMREKMREELEIPTSVMARLWERALAGEELPPKREVDLVHARAAEEKLLRRATRETGRL